MSFDRHIELFACDCVCAGQRSDRVSFDRCLVELFACDCVCVCLQVRGQIECRLTCVSPSCLRVIVRVCVCRSDRVSFDRCLVELFACDCVCAGQRSDRVSFDRCLELFACDCVCVCLQVRGQIECRLTGVSPSCLRVIVRVCVCRSDRVSFDRCLELFACDCVCMCVSAGQRSDRVSFDRCLVELFACDCVCAGQRSDRVSFDRCLSESFACD